MKLLKNELVLAFAFIFVYILRVFSPLLIFFYPLSAVLFNTFLDIIDGDTSSNFLTKDQYQRMDKNLDFWWLTVVLVWSLFNLPQYGWALLGLYIYRFLGVILFTKTRNRSFIFLFPNFFKYFFFLVFFAKEYEPFGEYFRDNFIPIVLFMAVFKLFHEYWLHIAKKSIIEDIFKRKRKWS